MSPYNGQKKKKKGLSWVYRKPPGVWEVEPTVSALESHVDYLREHRYLNKGPHLPDDASRPEE